MASIEKYYTYEGRLASFRKTTKKRGSASVRGGAKPLNWPHKQITPASLANAGFYFSPNLENPDNCTCFLCQKDLDGWVAGDDPLVEHLKHAPRCGWAVVKAIEAEIEDYFEQDPTQPHMVEAREATFAERWPHQGKKGWMCQIEQLVKSGWIYTPTDDSDDMATCMYCQLALDGWEPEDNPYDEHFNRSPNCTFFALVAESELASKAARGKGMRASKASRISTQSAQLAAVTPEEAKVVDEAIQAEDSIVTTTSTTMGKKPRAKKATTKAAKGGRKKTKRETTPADAGSDASDAGDESEVVAKPPPTKSTRGRKRGSEAVDDSVMSSSAPAAKKRAAKVRASATDMSEKTNFADVSAPTKPKGGRQSKTKMETTAVFNSSVVSSRSTPEAFPDDDEIERQLEADLERQLTEDEFVYEYRRASVQSEAKPASDSQTPAYRMLNPEPSEAGDVEIEDELETLQNEMQVDEPEEELDVPKKGRKVTGTRKVSKQTKAKKVLSSPPASSLSPPPPPSSPPAIESIEKVMENDCNIISTDTAVKNAGLDERGDGRRSRDSFVISEDSVDVEMDSEQDENETEPERTHSTDGSSSPSPGPDEQLTNEAKYATRMVDGNALLVNDDDEVHIAEDNVDPATVLVAASLAEPLSTPGHVISPAPSAKQAALSPSQSPQSSDAENQPPCSKRRSRVAAGMTTPCQMSPSKRNVIAGLQSRTPWTAAKLDRMLGTLGEGGGVEGDAEMSIEGLLGKGKELSSREKQMTVEEWIYSNAEEAEKKLKHECERMVGMFESEGTRAMGVLEGLAVE